MGSRPLDAELAEGWEVAAAELAVAEAVAEAVVAEAVGEAVADAADAEVAFAEAD